MKRRLYVTDPLECDDVAENCSEPVANVLIRIWLPSDNLYSHSPVV